MFGKYIPHLNSHYIALTNTSSPKRRGLLIAGGVSLVLTLTVIGIGIGVGLYLGSSGVSQSFFYASQSIVFVNYVFRSDGSKPMQNETETGIYDILAKLKTLLKDRSRCVLHLLNCSCTRPAGFP